MSIYFMVLLFSCADYFSFFRISAFKYNATTLTEQCCTRWCEVKVTVKISTECFVCHLVEKQSYGIWRCTVTSAMLDCTYTVLGHPDQTSWYPTQEKNQKSHNPILTNIIIFFHGAINNTFIIMVVIAQRYRLH